MSGELRLASEEKEALEGGRGPAPALAMRILCRMARVLGAREFVPISSAHIDGCLYHGDGGVHFAEHLVELGAKARVPSTLNVGALDLLHPDRVKGSAHDRRMALRQMQAYAAMDCVPTWTCAPYQAGHRPDLGEDVAWGESNAVVFANSVLGARTNRYGDFMDILCAVAGRAPKYGLHLEENRRASLVVKLDRIQPRLKRRDAFYPVLGAWLGAHAGEDVPAIVGIPDSASEDQLKALGAASASTGAVGLFHAVGVTPEAPTLEDALGGGTPLRALRPSAAELQRTRDSLSTTRSQSVDAIAVGSPHLSLEQLRALSSLLEKFAALKLPFFACTGRAQLEAARENGTEDKLKAAGVTIVADTCVVVAPVLPGNGGVLMTNSGKFAHYAPANTGYDVVYGSLLDCVRTAASGRLQRDEELWTCA